MPIMELLYAKERAQQVSLLPHYLSTSFINSVLAATGVGIMQPISIPGDFHFVLRYVNITTYAAGLVISTASSPLTIFIIDTGGRTLLDNPQPIQNICGGLAASPGNGLLPGVLPEPWVLRAGTQVQITLANLGAAAVVRADVTLGGVKVYKFGTTSPGDIGP